MNSVMITRFEMLALEKELSQCQFHNRPRPDRHKWIEAYRTEREQRIKASRANKLAVG